MSAIAIDTDLSTVQPRVLDVSHYYSPAETFDGIRVSPYKPVLGARVEGLRLKKGQALPDTTVAYLRRKLLDRGFLYFEPGTVDVDGFVDLVQLFGEARFYGGPYTPPPEGHKLLNTIDSKIKKTNMNFIWHVDGGYYPDPPKMTALFATAVPEYGGDTLFSNAVAAYDLLDPLFAQYLETLTAVHSGDTVGHLPLSYHADPEGLAAQRAKYPPRDTPVIRVHPETGRKQVFVNESYTFAIRGVTRAVSQNLLNILFDLIKSPELHARVSWEQGAVVIWDNRSVQHCGVNDYSGGGRRALYRATLY